MSTDSRIAFLTAALDQANNTAANPQIVALLSCVSDGDSYSGIIKGHDGAVAPDRADPANQSTPASNRAAAGPGG